MRPRNRTTKRGLITLATTLFITLIAASCLGASSHDKPVVYFGINLRYDPIVMYKRYQPMMDFLTEQTPYRFELKISRSYKETLQNLVQGKTAIASIGDGAVAEAIIGHGAVPILKPLNPQGKPLYRSCIVVATTSKIRRSADLKGKKIALGYRHSLTGNLIARKLLQDRGLDRTTTIVSLGKHSAVAKAVLKGEVDAGILKDVVGRIYLKRGLQVIDCSEEFPSTPIIAGPDTSPAVIAAVTQALVALDRRKPKDLETLGLWDEEYRYGFAAVRKGDYDRILRLFRAVPYGCGTGCHR